MSKKSLEEVVCLLDLVEHALNQRNSGELGVLSSEYAGEEFREGRFPTRGVIITLREIRNRVLECLNSGLAEETAISPGNQQLIRENTQNENLLNSLSVSTQAPAPSQAMRSLERPADIRPQDLKANENRSGTRMVAENRPNRGLAGRIQMSPIPGKYGITGAGSTGTGSTNTRGNANMAPQASSGVAREIMLTNDGRSSIVRDSSGRVGESQ